jgi:hypothetical protein
MVDIERHGYVASTVRAVFASLWVASPWKITTFSELGQRVHKNYLKYCAADHSFGHVIVPGETFCEFLHDCT